MSVDKQILLHIGFGKTGTSAIQKLLFNKRQILKGQGVYYPDIAVYENAHHHISNYRIPKMSDVNKKLLAIIMDKFKNNDCQKLLLSSEQFCFCKPEYVKEVCSYFKNYPVSVIFYYRKQQFLLPSAYLQHVKAGADFLKGGLNGFFHHAHRAFDFIERLQAWDDALGKESIKVRLYRDGTEKFDSPKDFCDFLGLDRTNMNIDNDDGVLINNSILPELEEIMLLLNKQDIDAEIRLKVQKKFEDLSVKYKSVSDQKMISSKLQNEICQFYRKSNLKFIERYNVNSSDAEYLMTL